MPDLLDQRDRLLAVLKKRSAVAGQAPLARLMLEQVERRIMRLQRVRAK